MAAKKVGGQAVIEGVMMRGQRTVSVAVRRPEGDIVVQTSPIYPATRRWPMLKWPLLRGMLALVESLSLGISALTYSANQAAEEGEELSSRDLALSLGLALVAGVGLFIVLPTVLVRFLAGAGLEGASVLQLNLVEGLIRLGVFFAYVASIALMGDVRRFFQYHGAEHKVIHTYEADNPLDIATIQHMSPLHPRCGTAFLLYVMVVSILLFSLVGWPSLLLRVVSRLVLLPVVAGLAYELIRASGQCDSPVVRILGWPGLWLQKLTTREPDDQQLEVALEALQGVLAEEG